MLTTYSPQINTHHGEAYQLAIRPLTDLGVSCDSSKLLNTLEILDEDNKRAVIEAVLEIIYIINPALKS